MEGASQERLSNSGLAMTQLERTLCFFDGIIQQSLPQKGLREDRMGAPGGRLSFDSPVEVLSCVIGLAFPHKSTAQGQ